MKSNICFQRYTETEVPLLFTEGVITNANDKVLAVSTVKNETSEMKSFVFGEGNKQSLIVMQNCNYNYLVCLKVSCCKK